MGRAAPAIGAARGSAESGDDPIRGDWMTETSAIGGWLLFLDWVIRLAALAWIPSRTTPAAARSWLLLVGFVPLLGLPLYLLFGHPWLSRERIRRQAEASQMIRDEQKPLVQLRWHPTGDGADTEMVPLVERLGDFMPTHGNAVTLLDDYEGSLRALLEDIAGARDRVHLLYYLMFDDQVGDLVCEALLQAAARGVQCRLMLDAVGAKRGLRAYTARLRAGGVQVQELLPGGLRWRRSGRIDLRNHRKIAVIDNRAAYVGSQNLADAGAFVRGYPNRELVARVEGPAVSHLEAVFASDWYLETGQRLEVIATTPVRDANVAAQLLPSGPAYPFSNARDMVCALIHLAQQKLVMVTPYFVPDDATLSALRIAALSGVDTQLILSASNNQTLTAWAQESYYGELLASGVKIAHYRPHFLHAKHMSVDDSIALVGSMNLDIRSFALNAEVGMLCYDADVVASMRRIEAGYLAQAEQLTLERWNRRPAWKRSREGIARLADSFI